MLPKTPKKRFAGRFAPPASRTPTPERLRSLVRKHEEEERPFDPEKRGTWRGGARELVVNPGQFEKDLADLILNRWGRTLRTDPEEALQRAKEILKEGGRPWEVLGALDELLETHGVETIPGIKDEISYLNAGDTYDPTIMYSSDENKYFISDWGSIVEEASSEAEEDAWGDWLESEVRSDLESEFEGRLEDQEKLLDRVTDLLQGLESDELKHKFWRTLQDTGGEYVHESDGSVFVSGKDKAVSALADDLIRQAKAVPEQETFGFNPRREPRPKFSVGDRVRDREVRDRVGEVVVIGAYDSHLGGYRYKVQADGGPRHYWNEPSMELEVPRRSRNSGAAMTAEEFVALVKSESDVRGRALRTSISPRSGQVFINYYNLPEEIVARREGGGAEAENNRFMFTVEGFSSGRTGSGQGVPIAATKVKLEHGINSGHREYSLRGKTGSPEQVARYLAAFLTKVATEVPPKYTHTRAPNARRR